MAIPLDEVVVKEEKQNLEYVSVIREPLVTGGKTVHDVTEDICRQVEGKPTLSWMSLPIRP